MGRSIAEDSLEAPLLVIHGGRDRGVPSEAARRIADEARGPARFMEFPTGIHCCHNIAYRVNTQTAEWLAEQAGAAAATLPGRHRHSEKAGRRDDI